MVNELNEWRYGGGLKLSRTNSIFAFAPYATDNTTTKKQIPPKLRYIPLKRKLKSDNDILLFKLQYMQNQQNQKIANESLFDSITGIDKGFTK